MSAAEQFSAPVPPQPRVVPFKRIAEIEYFALDSAAELRLEYFDGEVVAMAGASPKHNDITCNTLAWLHNRLREGSAACVPLISAYPFPRDAATSTRM